VKQRALSRNAVTNQQKKRQAPFPGLPWYIAKEFYFFVVGGCPQLSLTA
jgi:hypothetical protein